MLQIGGVQEIHRLQKMPQLRDTLFRACPIIIGLHRRQAGAADGQRLRLQGQFILRFMAHQDEPHLARQLARLEGTMRLGKLRRSVAADALLAELAAWTLQQERARHHRCDFRIVG